MISTALGGNGCKRAKAILSSSFHCKIHLTNLQRKKCLRVLEYVPIANFGLPPTGTLLFLKKQYPAFPETLRKNF